MTEKTPIKISGALISRNWVFNLAGQALPLVVALATMPYVVRRLGAERFGILSIAWALLGYFSFLDLGLGRATTKFVAEQLGRGDLSGLSALVWTSVWIQAAIALCAVVIVVPCVPLLSGRILKISTTLQSDARLTFLILALSLPVVLVGNSLRGVLEAGQHFHAVNLVRLPASSSNFVLPVVGLLCGLGLPGIVLLLALSRLGSGVAYLIYCFHFYPELRTHAFGDSNMLRKLLIYGGWVTVSNVISPLMTYLDRFFIGSVISMTAVGYYSAPYEAVSRVSVLPSSLTSTIFPAFSSLDASGASKRLEELCVRSLKSLLLILGPLLLLVVGFSHEILRVFLGPEFADKGTLVLQILAVGVLINSLAWVPFSLLQGLGRPDLTAKFHLIEVPVYALSLWFFLTHWGIAGAAAAWTLRVTLDALLLFGATLRLGLLSPKGLLFGRLGKALAAVSILGGSLAVPSLAERSLGLQGIFASTFLIGFAFVSWKYLLDSPEKSILLATAEHFRSSLKKAR